MIDSREQILNSLKDLSGKIETPLKSCDYLAMIYVNLSDNTLTDTPKESGTIQLEEVKVVGNAQVIPLINASITRSGIVFNSSSDSAWFSIPSVDCTPITLSGIVRTNDLGPLYNHYKKQFRNGLINIRRSIDVSLFEVKSTQDNDTVLDTTSGYATALVGGQSILSTYDLIQDLINKAKLKTDEIITGPFNMKKIASYERCILSAPKWSVDGRSNEFTTISLEARYKNYKQYRWTQENT